MKPTLEEVAIVHLVRAANKTAAVAQFIDSYVRYPAGHDHRLIFLLKGFEPDLPPDLVAILDRTPHVRLLCPDGGYDIGSYYYATERITEPVVLFFNSFSVLGGENWLLKLVQAYRQAGVGLVGATGSWESLASTLLTAPNLGDPPRAARCVARMKELLLGMPLLALFPAFPNPHVRSNAFMLAREDFLAIRPARMRSKIQAWLFESGRSSMTRRILRRGLKTMVVGRDGTAYAIQDWSKSHTFWQDRQENLLVHDNRTMAYSRATPTTQAQLFRAAWNCLRD